MEVRTAQTDDAATLAAIFYEAVRGSAYAPQQRAAWAPQPPTPESFAERLAGLVTLLAVQDNAVLGFVSMRMADGYLDFAFVRPAAQGKGVFATLNEAIQKRAVEQGLTRLHVEASIMLMPILRKQGWDVVAPNTVTRGDQTIENFIMERHLDATPRRH